MMLESLPHDSVLNRAFGILGRVMLWPLPVCVGLAIGVTCDRPRALLRRHPVDHHLLNTVVLFNTRCRFGGFLKRCGRHSLPLLVGLVEGRIMALELVRTDWTRVP